MDSATFDTTLNSLKERIPFRPFTVSLVNGDRFEVDFPGALVVREGAAAFIGPGRVVSIFDYESVSHITNDLMQAEGSR
jgi:hypothetical protein